ncbi:hypothetical protein V9T40_001046 [Parthenolecanium corni]|uniref:Uncharacterized protein n=1 Tax=Parthenolecanium corni TaxID=536013 RepID=A0AAN9TNI7_9HEMI
MPSDAVSVSSSVSSAFGSFFTPKIDDHRIPTITNQQQQDEVGDRLEVQTCFEDWVFRLRGLMVSIRVVRLKFARKTNYEVMSIESLSILGLLDLWCRKGMLKCCSNEFSQAGWLAHQIWSSCLADSTDLVELAGCS